MPVIGLGGYFFRAAGPRGAHRLVSRDARRRRRAAARTRTAESSDWFWFPEPGPVVFAPFKASTDYFAADKQVMLDLRVRDLDGLLEQLNALGIDDDHQGRVGHARNRPFRAHP